MTNRRISLALESTLNAFVADSEYKSCSKTLGFLSYYWSYTYDANGNDMIFIDTRICCGAEAATFSSAYSAPSGFTLGTGAPFIDADEDGDIDDDDTIKAIIVFSICGLVLCLCIIAGIILFRKYQQKKKVEMETSTVMAETKNSKQNNITAISPSSTNDV